MFFAGLLRALPLSKSERDILGVTKGAYPFLKGRER